MLFGVYNTCKCLQAVNNYIECNYRLYSLLCNANEPKEVAHSSHAHLFQCIEINGRANCAPWVCVLDERLYLPYRTHARYNCLQSSNLYIFRKSNNKVNDFFAQTYSIKKHASRLFLNLTWQSCIHRYSMSYRGLK